MDNYSESRKGSLVKVHLFGIFFGLQTTIQDNNAEQDTGKKKKKMIKLKSETDPEI